MKITDGAGREGDQISFDAYRPDLPPCARCDSGKKCNCQVYELDVICACIGFLSCPECPRERSGLIIYGDVEIENLEL